MIMVTKNAFAKTWKWLVAALIGALAVFFLLSRGGAQGAAPTGNYETVNVDRGAINQSVATSGSVRPLVTVQVGSQLSGQVAELYVDFNSEVKKDQLVARIDPQTFATRVAAARADRAVALASLNARKADLRRVVALLEQAKNDFERFNGLDEDAGLSAQELDGFRAQYQAAIANRDSAKAQVENAKALVIQREASLEQAEVDLTRTEIRSPIDGVVILRSVDVGQTVAASLSAPVLFEIAQDLSRIQIEADVNEADIGAINAGNDVSFTVDAFPGQTFTGRVETVRLAPTELQNVVTYTVIIHADNPGRILYPGMTATVEIITGQREDSLRIPNAAARFQPDNAEAIIAQANKNSDSNSSSRGNQRGGRGRGNFSALTQELDLSKEQQTELQTRMRALFSGGPPPGGGNNRRQRMQAIFKSVLSDEQYQKYLASQKNRPQRKTIWILGDDQQLEPRTVFLGISDGRYTEVVRGTLQENEQLVLRKVVTPSS